MVYVGPKGWSRRSEEYELTDEDILEGIHYAGSKGKGIRIAFNILFNSEDEPHILEKIAFFIERGAAGLILTDPGLIATVRRRFPEIPIHASVGCTIVNAADFQFYKDIGTTVIVSPVRLSIEDIRTIREKVLIDVEILIHANRDFTYLGRCTMSSYFGYHPKRLKNGKVYYRGSPNRGGLCYRVCKRTWSIRSPGGEEVLQTTLQNDYFSDLENIPRYLEAGVRYLKLQGREFSPRVVGDLVAFYRDLLDEMEERGVNFTLTDNHRERLSVIQQHREAERTTRTHELLAQCEAC